MEILEKKKLSRVRIIIQNRPIDITKLKRSTMHFGRQLAKFCNCKKLKKTTIWASSHNKNIMDDITPQWR
jgi:hypothetical protein